MRRCGMPPANYRIWLMFLANSINVESGAVQLPVPVKDGAQFVGWHISPDYSDECVQSVVCSAADITLYAEWSDRVYTVEYDLGGGTAEGDNPVSVGAGEVHELFPAVKAGHEFLGWNTSPDGSGEYVQALYGVDGDMALYAKRYRLLLFPFRYRPCRRFCARV